MKIVSLIVAVATIATQLILTFAAVFQVALNIAPSGDSIAVSNDDYYLMPLLFVGVGLGLFCALFLVVNITTDILTIQSLAEYYEKSDLMYILLFSAIVIPFIVAYLFHVFT